jgi:membrane protein
MTKKIIKILAFIKTDIWRIRAKDLSLIKALAIKQLRVLLLSIRGVSEDNLYLRASALTFYSLLSIVPVLAMAFGIAKGFGFEKTLEEQLFHEFPGQTEVLGKVIEFANSMLATTKGGIVAGIGLVVLFWTVIRVIGNIEIAFNDIWGITENRSFGRKFSDYLSIILICPLLLIMAGSATVFVTTQITLITEKIALIGYFKPLIFFFLKAMPLGVMWGLFTFLYVLMPNTRVKITSGLIAGIIAGAIYQLVQWGYIAFQVGTAKYNAIYGSFAALPLFLVWLQLSWLIVLFGAEISFASQNVDTYEFEPDCRETSPYFKALLSLAITRLVIKNFSTGEKPLTAEDVSHLMETPVRLVRELIHTLVESGILSQIKTETDKETAYHPSMDINFITIQSVLAALVYNGSDNLPLAVTAEINILSDTLNTFKQTIADAPKNKLLKDI